MMHHVMRDIEAGHIAKSVTQDIREHFMIQFTRIKAGMEQLLQVAAIILAQKDNCHQRESNESD